VVICDYSEVSADVALEVSVLMLLWSYASAVVALRVSEEIYPCTPMMLVAKVSEFTTFLLPSSTGQSLTSVC
jgi:hypothetical protein